MKDAISPHVARALSTPAAAIYTSPTESFLEKARINMTKTPGPKFTKLGWRVVYLLEDLDHYLENPPSA